MSQSLRQFGGYLAGFASLFLAWHVAATYMFASVLFPPPLKVLATAIELARDGSLGENAAVSLRRIFLGFAGGSLIGIPVGLSIGSFRIVRQLLEPYTEFLRFLPATALITIPAILFGIGQRAQNFFITYI